MTNYNWCHLKQPQKRPAAPNGTVDVCGGILVSGLDNWTWLYLFEDVSKSSLI